MKKIYENLDGSFHSELGVRGEEVVISAPFTKTETKNRFVNGDEILTDGAGTGEFEQIEESYCIFDELIAEGYVVVLLAQAEKDKATKEQTQAAITTTYNQQINAIVGTIPQSEIDTWPTQKDEALAYAVDNDADVPFIQGLANERRMQLSELVPRILQKAAMYRNASSKALGQKHAAEDAL